MHTQLYAYSITSVILVGRVYPCDLRIHTFTARVNSVEIWSIDPSMDDLGVFARDLGYKPQGKSAPMKSSSGSDRFTTTSASLFSDDQFSDVFGGPPKYSSSSNNNTASPMSDFDYDSIFKSSATNEPKNKSNSASAVPVYDKPIYDEDIFDGLPGLKSKSVSASAKHEENVFASMSSSSPPRKPSGGNQFDDLLGNLGRREKVEPKKKEDKSARDFDDLLPGFSSSSPINRPSSEPSQTPKPTGNSNQTTKVMMDDPFVVLESSSTPGVSSPGFYNDPLEEISKLSKSGNAKPDGSSVSGGVFDDIDPLSDFGKSVPAYSSGMNNRRKDGSPSSTGSSTRKTQDSAGNEALGRSSFNYYSESHSQKKVPVDDYQESHQTIFDMPTVSKDSQKSFGQRASSPSYVNANFNETNSQGDMSPRSEEHLHTSDDVWLTVSEIPLFTQPTKAPPPSRPPPPIPRHTFKSERAFSASNARNKNNNEFSSSPNSAKYSQSPKPFHPAAKDPEISSIDDLENFAMARNRNNVNENTDVQSPSENIDTNSTAAASAAAMKEAMDRAEAKFRHAKEVREREHAKAARNKESVQLERDEQETWEEELRENQERMNRERQQREREEEEREQRRIERERARQAVERATREARERAAVEAREKAAADARLKNERAAVQRAQAEARERAAAEARERAERAATEARERANAEAREKEVREKAAVARAEADARRRAERAAVDRVAAAARERAAAEARERAAATAAARANQQKNDDDLESFFNMGSRPSSAPRPRASTSDPTADVQFPSRSGPDGARRASQSGVPSNMKKASSTTNIVDDLSSIFGVASASSAGDFQDVEGETEERRRARLERHQRTQERAAKALAEKNQRDLQTLRDQEERHRIAETLDIEIKRWAAGKEGNLRALLSTMQYVLWPECGWQPVSLTDLITGASVKKVYRKATLCIHPDKVQQKGANLQQKYIAEKVFDLLKEAWNKFNSEELF